jgi:hypothetical protein
MAKKSLPQARETTREPPATKADIAALREEIRGCATKKDMESFATKKDLESFATKKDLESFATKKDLESFATKKDMEAMVHEAMNHSAELAAEIEQRAIEREEKAQSYFLALAENLKADFRAMHSDKISQREDRIIRLEEHVGIKP